MAHNQKDKISQETHASVAQRAEHQIQMDEVPGSMLTFGYCIFCLHRVKPLMPMLPLLLILCVCENLD